MNLYEISVVDGKGITHKSKVYEINVDAAFKEAFIQGKIYGAEKLDDCTVQQIQTNAGLEGSVIIDNIKRTDKAGYGFDAFKEEYTDMISAGIVDPAKVTRSALQNAASVAAMVLTTESLVTDIKEEAPAAAAAPGMGGMGGMY